METPSHLKFPTLLLNFPLTVSNKVRNNPWMTSDVPYDYERAFAQWMNLYKLISQEALVYILPSDGNFQDQPYCANIGCYLPHCDKMLVSNFKSEPRKGEEFVAANFFKMMKYEIYRPSSCWEGEADLKLIKDNLYFGGYGIRSDIESYQGFQKDFNMDVICIKMHDQRLYHLDCLVLPLKNNTVLAIKDTIPRLWYKKFNIIEVPNEFKYDAWTNSLILNNKWFYYLTTDNKDSHKQLEEVIRSLGYVPVFVDISEFEKSGAALSCLIFHLNYI